jgi:predicted transcriptional regulator
MAAVAPIKIDAATDELVSHAAHFLVRTKKDIVESAVREYVDAHRDEINAGIKAALDRLNGSDAAAVALVTGLDLGEIEELGGMPEESDQGR